MHACVCGVFQQSGGIYSTVNPKELSEKTLKVSFCNMFSALIGKMSTN